MKSFRNILGCLFVLLSIISCSSDDGETAPTNTSENLEVVGVWDLVAVNISSGQDLNLDGTASTNLVEELSCITGSLLINENMVWTFEQSNIAVSTITSGVFFAQCSGTQNDTGNWSASQTQLTLVGDRGEITTLTISGNQLINNVGEDLPGILSFVYELRQ